MRLVVQDRLPVALGNAATDDTRSSRSEFIHPSLALEPDSVFVITGDNTTCPMSDHAIYCKASNSSPQLQYLLGVL